MKPKAPEALQGGLEDLCRIGKAFLTFGGHELLVPRGACAYCNVFVIRKGATYLKRQVVLGLKMDV